MKELPKSFYLLLAEDSHIFNWDMLCSCYVIPEHVLQDHIYKVIPHVWRKQSVSLDFCLNNSDKINFFLLSFNNNIKEEVLRHFKDQMKWLYFSKNYPFTKELIIEFVDYINFDYLLRNENISQEVKDYCRMFI